jgi:hypothetical protein
MRADLYQRIVGLDAARLSALARRLGLLGEKAAEKEEPTGVLRPRGEHPREATSLEISLDQLAEQDLDALVAHLLDAEGSEPEESRGGARE